MMNRDTMTAVTSTTTTVSKRRPWAVSLARRYARRQLRAKFDGVFVNGLEHARVVVGSRPVIFACNHVCWWDSFALIVLDEALGGGGHAVMDEANLRRLPFFGAIGAVPVARDGGARLRRQIDDASRLIKRPGASLWFFPQGRQRAAHLRPLDLLPGLRLFARHSGADVIPVSLSYLWREAPVPSVVVTLHPPVPAKQPDLLAAVEAAIVTGLDAHDYAVDQGLDPGTALLPPQPRKGPQDGRGARALARLASDRKDAR